jgi:hypothetical protein
MPSRLRNAALRRVPQPAGVEVMLTMARAPELSRDVIDRIPVVTMCGAPGWSTSDAVRYGTSLMRACSYTGCGMDTTSNRPS